MSDNFTNTEAQAQSESVNPMDKPAELAPPEFNTLQNDFINTDPQIVREAYKATEEEALRGESLALADFNIDDLSDDEGIIAQEDNVLDDDIVRLEEDQQSGAPGYARRAEMIDIAKVVDSELKNKLEREQEFEASNRPAST